MKLAIIIPSRGLIFSKTVESLFNAVSHVDLPYRLFFSHDNPIPDCFNKPIQEALKDPEITHLVILEEDVILPENGLEDMLIADSDIAFFDYPLDSGRVTNVFHGILMSGPGLIMFKREALEQLLPFRTDKEISLNPITESDIPLDRRDKVYGRHDIQFFYHAHQLGLSITEVGKTDHLRIVEMGQKGVNDGWHKIVTLK